MTLLTTRIACVLLVLAACNDAVSPPPGGDPGGLGVAFIEIQPTPLLIMPGDTLQLAATVRNAAGAIIPNAPVSWTASPQEIPISATGRLIVPTEAFYSEISVSARSENVTAAKSLRICGRGAVWTDRSSFVVTIEPGGLEEGWWNSMTVLYGAGMFYGTSAADLVIPASMIGTIVHREGFTSYTCSVDVAGGQYTRSTIVLRDNAPVSPVRALQETFSPTLPGTDRILLLRYTFTNITNATVSGFQVGLAFDWDLGFDLNGGNDRTRWNAVLKAAETFEADSAKAGVTAIGSVVTMYRGVGDNWPLDPTQHFQEFAKGISSAVIGPRDVGQILGFGPFDIAPGASTSVMVGLTFGLTPQEFAANIEKARTLGAAFPNL